MRIATKLPIKKGKRPCPDCGAALVKRTSERLHPLYSETMLICKNPDCGATFVGCDEITHRLSPPADPNPSIALPYAPTAARRNWLEEIGLLDESPRPTTQPEAMQ